MLYSREDYYVQVESYIRQKGEDRGIGRRDFQVLYEAAIGNVVYEDTGEVIENLIRYLFGVPVVMEAMVPWSFWNTPVGQAIAAVKFKTERFYTVEAVADLYGCEKSFIYGEIDREKLKPVAIFGDERKRGNKIFSETELNRFLYEKGKPSVSELKKMKKRNESVK